MRLKAKFESQTGWNDGLTFRAGQILLHYIKIDRSTSAFCNLMASCWAWKAIHLINRLSLKNFIKCHTHC